MTAISERFNAALAALSRGDLASARSQGEAALRAQPANPAVLQLLGIIFCQSGDLGRGVGYLRKAIDLGGDTADNRFNLARALVELGSLDEAAALCDGPVAQASPELQRLKADILKAQGRLGEAVWAYEQFTLTHPDEFEGWNNLGNARHEMGDLEGALAALQQARLLKPDSSIVNTNMGRVLVSMDRYEDACLIFEKAALCAPKDPAPLVELGRTLMSIDHPANALKALGTAARLDPKDPKIFVAIGLAFNDVGDLAQAERAHRFAIQADPKHAPGYINLGILLEKANRVDELEDLIGKANAAGVEVDYLRALLLSRKGDTREAYDLARAIQSDAVNSAMAAHFAGQLADRLNLIDEAFAAFEAMNKASAQSPMGVGLDRSAYQRGIQRLETQTTREWFSGWPVLPAITNPPSPAFLVGFPRSGTTLLDTLLMGHSGTHVLEEIPILEKLSGEVGELTRLGEMGAAEIAELRQRYFEELEKTSPAPPGKLVIDKNPLSMLRVPLIHRLFPDAKIILAMRHPCDVVLSCFMQNFKATEAMSSFFDLSNGSRTYDRIFSYWEKCREVFPIQVQTLRYESMVADPEAAIRPLIEFLGLEWESELLDHKQTAVKRGYIRTPSYAQVTENVYASASGRWVRYRKYMDEALPILEPWVERYGYSLG